MRACVRDCVRACVLACVRACVRAYGQIEYIITYPDGHVYIYIYSDNVLFDQIVQRTTKPFMLTLNTEQNSNENQMYTLQE